MMISPVTYLEEFKKKLRVGQVQETRRLRAEILSLEKAVKNNEFCSTEPSFEVQLKCCKLYEEALITYMIDKMFDGSREKDPTWLNGAGKFILACRKCELTNLGLEELVDYFTIKTDLNDLKSYEKFEHFKKYNNSEINDILTCSPKTKLSYYRAMQIPLRDFPLWFSENEEVPRLSEPSNALQEAENMDEIKIKYKITPTIVEKVKHLNIDEHFCFRDLLAEYNLTEKQMMSVTFEALKQLKGLVENTHAGAVQGLIHNVEFVRINPEEKFKKIPYSFYLYYSLGDWTFKLSKDCFALMHYNEIFEITNSEKTAVLWCEFLKFVKSAKTFKYKKTKRGVETGVVVKEYWKNPFKKIFSKLPDEEQTLEYLIEKFKENGCNVEL